MCRQSSQTSTAARHLRGYGPVGWPPGRWPWRGGSCRYRWAEKQHLLALLGDARNCQVVNGLARTVSSSDLVNDLVNDLLLAAGLSNLDQRGVRELDQNAANDGLVPAFDCGRICGDPQSEMV